MNTYAFRFDIGISTALGSLNQLQQRFGGTLAHLNTLTSRFGSFFSGRFQNMTRSASQSVEQLRAKLDGLTRRRDLMIDTRQISRANREIQQLENRIGHLQNAGRSGGTSGAGGGGGGGSGGMLGGLKSMLPALGIAGLIAGGGALAKSGMDREQTKVAFEQFVGKSGVNPLMKQLNTFADVTPYSNEDVYGAGRNLLAAKVGPGQLTEKLTNLGNLSAVSQKDFGDVSKAYAMSKQRGIVGNDLLTNQFAGTAVQDQLQKNLGVNGDQLFKMAEQRKVKFDDLDKAIADLSAKGGLYEGGLQKLSDTAGGKLSTFMGTLGNKVTEWAAGQNSKLAGIFDFGSKFLDKMGPIEEAFGKLVTAFSPLWDSLKGIAVAFGLVSENGTGVEGVVNAITGAINLLATAISVIASPFGQFVLLIAGCLKTAMMLNVGLNLLSTAGITTIGAGLKALWGIMLANPIGVILGMLVVLGTGFKLAYENVEWFRDGVDKVWGFLKEMFSNVGVILRALIAPTPANLKAAFAAVGKAWENAGASVEEKKQLQKRELAESDRDDRSGVYNPKKSPYGSGKPGGMGGGSAGGVGKAAGVEATVGGSKSTNITINLKALVEGGVHVHTANIKEGAEEIRSIVTDTLLRVLNSANSVAQ